MQLPQNYGVTAFPKRLSFLAYLVFNAPRPPPRVISIICMS